MTSASTEASAEPPKRLDSTVVLKRFGFDRERSSWCHALSQLSQPEVCAVVMIEFPPWLDVAAPLETFQRTAGAREARAKLETEPPWCPRFVWRHEKAAEDRSINPAHPFEFTIDVDLRFGLVTHAGQPRVSQ